MQNTKDIDFMWKGTQDAWYEIEIKNTRVVTTRLHICTCPPGNAGKSSKRREGICLLYIYIFTVHTVTFTFPGASVHVVKLGIYMYTAYRLDVRIPTHQARKILSSSLFLSNHDPWDTKENYDYAHVIRDVTMSMTSFPEYPGSDCEEEARSVGW